MDPICILAWRQIADFKLFADTEQIIIIDGTAEIIRRYGEKSHRIQIFHNEKNQKLPRSLNISFRYASGDYFIWTSDDNFYDTDAVEVMISFLEGNPQCGMACCDMNDFG